MARVCLQLAFRLVSLSQTKTKVSPPTKHTPMWVVMAALVLLVRSAFQGPQDPTIQILYVINTVYMGPICRMVSSPAASAWQLAEKAPQLLV